MAIRLRTVNGQRVALCAAETDPKDGDVYLDDADHHALGLKFARDWYEEGALGKRLFCNLANDAAAESQRVRDAEEECLKWNKALRVEKRSTTRRLDKVTIRGQAFTFDELNAMFKTKPPVRHHRARVEALLEHRSFKEAARSLDMHLWSKVPDQLIRCSLTEWLEKLGRVPHR